MNKKRKERLQKISRLIEGGFDGTIGSEKHHSEIQEYLREKNFGPDSNEESSGFYDLEKDVPIGIEGYGPGASAYMKDSLLPYSTEGMLDEDIHVYILDQSFFGENDEEYRKSIEVARFIFGPMNLGGVKVQVGTSDIETGGLRAKNKNLMNKSELISNLSAVLESHGNFGPGIDHTNYYDSEGSGSGEANPSDSSLYGLSKKEISKLPKEERDAYRLRNKDNVFKLKKKEVGVDADGDGVAGFPDLSKLNLDYTPEEGESLVRSKEDDTYDFESESSKMLTEKLSALAGKIVRFSKLKNIFAASIIHEEIPGIFKRQLGISDDEDKSNEDVAAQEDSTEKLEEEYKHPLYVNFFEDPRYGNVEFFLKPRIGIFVDALVSKYEKKVKEINKSKYYSEEKKKEKIEKLNEKERETLQIKKICDTSKSIKNKIDMFERDTSINPKSLSFGEEKKLIKRISANKAKIDLDLKNFRELMDSIEVLKRYFGDFEQYQIDTLEGNDNAYYKPRGFPDSEGDYDFFEEEKNNDEFDFSHVTVRESVDYKPNELTKRQMLPLEHLLMSIKKSNIPFALFVYDPNAGENISFSGIKHDIIHILKDPREQDKQLIKDITIPDGQEASGGQILKELNSKGNVERYDPKNYYNVGILFNGVYGVINRLAENIRSLLVEAEEGAGVDLAQYKEKLQSFDLRTFLQNKENVSEKQMERRKFKHDVLDFASRYMVANYKNYTDKDIFINNVWNSDRFQDIVQHIVFSTLLKGDLKNKNIIDFEIGSDEELVRDLNNWFKLNIDPDYPMYSKNSDGKKTKNNNDQWISIPERLKELFKNAAKGINKRAIEYLNGFKDGDMNNRFFANRKKNTSEFNRQTDELLKEEDKFYKVINESSELEDPSFFSEKALENFMNNIKSRPKLDGLIRRRLRFLSKDKDVVFCFIRLSAPSEVKLDDDSDDFNSLDED